MSERRDKRLRKRKHRWRVFKFAVLQHMLLPALIPFVKLWMRTWRVECADEFEVIDDRENPIVLAVLHGHATPLLGLLYRWHGKEGLRTVTLTSRSRDGQLMASAVARFGQQTVVGSTKRGGAEALLGLRRAMRNGKSAVISVDGPRGPRGVPQGGAVTLARSAKSRLYIMMVEVNPGWRLPVWDHHQVPKPFARVRAHLIPFRDYSTDRGDILADRAAMQQVMIEYLTKFGLPVDDIKRLE